MSRLDRFVRSITDYGSARSFGSRLRARRLAPLLRMVQQAHAARGSVRIIDVGGTEEYWNILPAGFLDAYDVHITLVNLPGMQPAITGSRFGSVEGDGCDLSRFADHAFDIAHSNSVIEHVGDWSRVVAFGSETARVARAYFLQTPYFWFPVEPHAVVPFFHWLPKPVRVRLIMRSALGHLPRGETQRDAIAIVESIHLMRKWELQAVMPTATLVTERFYGLPKSLIAIGPRSRV